jgi:hypothetical protein
MYTHWTARDGTESSGYVNPLIAGLSEDPEPTGDPDSTNPGDLKPSDADGDNSGGDYDASEVDRELTEGDDLPADWAPDVFNPAVSNFK